MLIIVGLRFALAALFMVAGFTKLPRRSAFAKAVRAYDLLPPSIASRIALVLPLFEATCGLLLLVGLATRLAAAAIALALCCFAAAVVINLLRGRVIDCGCFDAVAPKRITWMTAVRNLLLAASAIAVASAVPAALSIDRVLAGRPRSVSDSSAAAVAFASVLLLIALVLASESLRMKRVVRAFTIEAREGTA